MCYWILVVLITIASQNLIITTTQAATNHGMNMFKTLRMKCLVQWNPGNSSPQLDLEKSLSHRIFELSGYEKVFMKVHGEVRKRFEFYIESSSYQDSTAVKIFSFKLFLGYSSNTIDFKKVFMVNLVWKLYEKGLISFFSIKIQGKMYEKNVVNFFFSNENWYLITHLVFYFHNVLIV